MEKPSRRIRMVLVSSGGRIRTDVSLRLIRAQKQNIPNSISPEMEKPSRRIRMVLVSSGGRIRTDVSLRLIRAQKQKHSKFYISRNGKTIPKNQNGFG